MERPIPIPDDVSKPFWEAANERRLVAQFCVACSEWQHPPERACAECGATPLEFRELSGAGTIYSVHVEHDSRVVVMQQHQPYIVATVLANESPYAVFLTNLPGTSAGDVAFGKDGEQSVHIGARVAVEFEEVGAGRFVPQFRVVS